MKTTKKGIMVALACMAVFSLRAQEDANTLYVDSLMGQLPEVMIKGERPVVKAERGKLVYDFPGW